MINNFEIDICNRKKVIPMTTTHFHDFYELYYLVTGEISYFIEDNIYSVKKGDMIFIPPKTLHKTKPANNPQHKRILITFTSEFVNYFLKYNPNLLDFFNNKQLSIPKQKQDRIEQILYSMLSEYQNKMDIVMISSLLGELLVMLDRYSLKDDILNIIPDERYDKILNVVRYINREYTSDITLEMLSKMFYINPSYLSRSFKKATGFTYIEYLNKIRIKQATYLLLNTTQNVTSIAFSVGFSSANHFCKMFKSVVGISPLNYRNKY